MILLSFWDPAEHLILLTEFLLLEKVQEEEWLHPVHTLDKHATKQENKKNNNRQQRKAILIRVISGMAALSTYHRYWKGKENFVGKKMSPNVIHTHFNLGILWSYRCMALNPFGRGKGWDTFLASSIPLPCPLASLFCRSAGHYKYATIRQIKSQV